MKPRSYLFIAARVTSDGDLKNVIQHAHHAGLVSDGVGLFAFRPLSESLPTSYLPAEVPPEIELARVLWRACLELRAIKVARPEDA